MISYVLLLSTRVEIPWDEVTVFDTAQSVRTSREREFRHETVNEELKIYEIFISLSSFPKNLPDFLPLNLPFNGRSI